MNPADDPVLPEVPLAARASENAADGRPTIPLRAESLASEAEAVVELVVDDEPAVSAVADNGLAAEPIENESDIIVVEDDPPPPPTPPAPHPDKVRRQEYRQLFARLRRS